MPYRLQLTSSAKVGLRKESLEAERRKAAEEVKDAKQKADTQSRRHAALQEACWLLQLDEEEGQTINPDGVFRHRNGFEFSNRELRSGIDYTTRLAVAKTLFNQQMNHLKHKTLMSSTSPFATKEEPYPDRDDDTPPSDLRSVNRKPTN